MSRRMSRTLEDVDVKFRYHLHLWQWQFTWKWGCQGPAAWQYIGKELSATESYEIKFSLQCFVGCNYLFLPEIPASGTKVHTYIYISNYLYKFDNNSQQKSACIRKVDKCIFQPLLRFVALIPVITYSYGLTSTGLDYVLVLNRRQTINETNAHWYSIRAQRKLPSENFPQFSCVQQNCDATATLVQGELR